MEPDSIQPTYTVHSEQEMLELGKKFAQQIVAADFAAPYNVIELVGDVGAGKTTFTRGLAEGLGAAAAVTSPSFTISKTYALAQGRRLAHYDFYRLADAGLMSDDLVESLRDSDVVTVVEWSNSVVDVLPLDRIVIKIKLNGDGSRKVAISKSHSEPSSARSRSPVVTGHASLYSLPVDRARPRKAAERLSLYLDTSTPRTILKLNDVVYEWESGRDLAEGLLRFMRDKLAERGKSFDDLTEIAFYAGPGSFTGLRIGASVVNTLAHELNIPLYDHHGQKQHIIIPNYGRDANISAPRK